MENHTDLLQNWLLAKKQAEKDIEELEESEPKNKPPVLDDVFAFSVYCALCCVRESRDGKRYVLNPTQFIQKNIPSAFKGWTKDDLEDIPFAMLELEEAGLVEKGIFQIDGRKTQAYLLSTIPPIAIVDHNGRRMIKKNPLKRIRS